MKDFLKWFGVTVFVTVIVFFAVGCEMDEEEEAIALSDDEYTSGMITTAIKEQWFSFTATASTHYIHVVHGTLSDLSIQVYDRSKNPVGSIHSYHESALNGVYGGWYTDINVTKGKLYYLKVTPYYNSGTGTYKVGCNTSVLSPGSLKTAKFLAYDTWVSGTKTPDDDDDDDGLYRFTAKSASTHYIHINLGTLPYMYVRLYDGSGSIVQERTTLSKSGYVSYQYLASGSVYYVSVWSTSNYGTYQIALNTSMTAPQ